MTPDPIQIHTVERIKDAAFKAWASSEPAEQFLRAA
jgi:hypothetical protein